LALPAACASAPARPSQGPVRIKDTVPERVAAQRAAQKDLNLEGEDERWGIEAARERKERARTDSGASSSAPAAPSPSGPGAEGHWTGGAEQAPAESAAIASTGAKQAIRRAG